MGQQEQWHLSETALWYVYLFNKTLPPHELIAASGSGGNGEDCDVVVTTQCFRN
jgi:hypothetical protein